MSYGGVAALSDCGLQSILANEISGGSGSLTATASGTQTTSAIVPNANNYFGTIATDQDGCGLPFGAIGARIVIVNGVAIKGLKVFAQGTDTINGVTGSTGLVQNGGTAALYVCMSSAPAAKWFRIGG